MNPHHEWNDELGELAEAYAAGALPAQRRSEYEGHLASCSLCSAEVNTLGQIVAGLALASPELTGSESAAEGWERISARLKDSTGLQHTGSIQTWRGWQADDPHAGPLGLFLRRDDGQGWEQTASPGVEARKLFSDPAADRVTMLVRMQPGSSYPAHRHAGPEECYVLEGDLQVGDDLEMKAGDFQRAESGSLHPVQSTRRGCLLLLQSSLSDELVA